MNLIKVSSHSISSGMFNIIRKNLRRKTIELLLNPPCLKVSWSAFSRILNFSSSCWYRFPEIILHKTLMADVLNNPATWIRLVLYKVCSKKSRTSSMIAPSIEVFPKPKSRKCRNVNLRWVCQNGPSVKIIPFFAVFDAMASWFGLPWNKSILKTSITCFGPQMKTVGVVASFRPMTGPNFARASSM